MSDAQYTVPELRGLILAGGRSSRMGEDKGKLSFHGRPQREHLFDLLKKFCSKVSVSCKPDDMVPAWFNPVADKFVMESPLNGILSAFQSDPQVAWLAIAVDMPLINELSIRILLEHRDPSRVATCFRDSEGILPEPLLTIWEPRAYPLLLKFQKKGSISPRQFLQNNDITLLDVPDKNMLMNINSKEELSSFLKKHRKGNE